MEPPLSRATGRRFSTSRHAGSSCRCRRHPHGGRARETVNDAGAIARGWKRWQSVGIVLLALAASAASLRNGFAIDDVIIIAGDSRIHRLDAPWRFFTQTYWPPPTKAALYRPLTSLAFALEWRAGDGRPLIFHAMNVLLYLLACPAGYRPAVLLHGGVAGWWAAALFAVHPVHVEAIANSVGQSELWTALWVVLAVAYYIEVRRTRDITAKDIALLSALYVTTCLFKEHAIVLPGLLVAA